MLSCSKVQWWKIRNRIYLVNWVHVLVCILSLTSPAVSSPPWAWITASGFSIHSLFFLLLSFPSCSSERIPSSPVRGSSFPTQWLVFSHTLLEAGQHRECDFPFFPWPVLFIQPSATPNIGSLSVFLPQWSSCNISFNSPDCVIFNIYLQIVLIHQPYQPRFIEIIIYIVIILSP